MPRKVRISVAQCALKELVDIFCHRAQSSAVGRRMSLGKPRRASQETKRGCIVFADLSPRFLLLFLVHRSMQRLATLTATSLLEVKRLESAEESVDGSNDCHPNRAEMVAPMAAPPLRVTHSASTTNALLTQPKTYPTGL